MTYSKANTNDPMPLYYQVYSSLLERIREGEFPPGAMLPSERQLVDEYGVSRTTVIKALDLIQREGVIERYPGKGSFVVDATDKVNEDQPSQLPVIVFICNELSKPYLQRILSGVVRVATEQHCHIQVIGLYGKPERDSHLIREVVSRGVNGLIVYPSPGFEQATLFEEWQDKIPTVMVDRYYPHLETARIVFDDEAASYKLTSGLIEKGHQRIAVLPYFEREVTSVRDRLNGYRRALKEYNIPYNEDLIWLDLYPASPKPGEISPNDPITRHLLRSHLETFEPTAIIAINYEVAEHFYYDLTAINAARLREAVNSGVTSLPKDIAVEIATFSYSARSVYTPYPFTVALQSGELLGAEATKLLIDLINGGITDKAPSIELPMTMENFDD